MLSVWNPLANPDPRATQNLQPSEHLDHAEARDGAVFLTFLVVVPECPHHVVQRGMCVALRVRLSI